jgi:hypothetical protein
VATGADKWNNPKMDGSKNLVDRQLF